MTSRDAILKRLRAAQTPFTNVAPIELRRRMTPLADESHDALRARFILEAEKVSVRVWPCADNQAAIDKILDLVGNDKAVIAWDFSHIPLGGLDSAFSGKGIEITGVRDSSARVGITGADAALATTGSIIVPTGPGKPRSASLLAPIHIAVIRESQIVADLESWFEKQRAVGLDDFRTSANTVIITGGSRTADIGQELIQGAHGPVEVHVVLIQ